MTVVPAVTVLIQPKKSNNDPNFWRYGYSNREMTESYRWTLHQLYRAPIAGVLLGLCLPVAGFLLSKSLTEQFFPPADRDQVSLELELSSSTALEETLRLAHEVRAVALENDEVANVHWFLGESSPSFFYNLIPRRKRANNYGQALVELKPDANSRETIHKLQNHLDQRFPRARILVRQLEQGPPFEAPVEVRLFGPDLAVLQEMGSRLRLMLSQVPEVVHTRADLEETMPKIALRINQHEARTAGLNHVEIAQQLYTTLEGMDAGTVMDATEELPVKVRVADSARGSLERIASLQMKPLTGRGRSEKGPPLSAIGDLELSSEVSAIPRVNGRRMNVVKGYITAGTLPAQVLNEFKARLEAADLDLSPGYAIEFAGEAAKRDDAVANLMANVGLLIALIIATLVSSFRSFRISLIITAVGGLSIGLGLGAIWTFGFPFGFMGMLGIMGLVGIAINDAIVVMAGIREDEKAREGDVEAITEVVIHRTRHILATSMTTIAGFTPLILGGGAFWPPVAVVIAGGIGGATILALYFVPSLYLIMLCRGGKSSMD